MQLDLINMSLNCYCGMKLKNFIYDIVEKSSMRLGKLQQLHMGGGTYENFCKTLNVYYPN